MAILIETLIFEHDGTNVPVEILETKKGSRFVAVDHYSWNKLTLTITSVLEAFRQLVPSTFGDIVTSDYNLRTRSLLSVVPE